MPYDKLTCMKGGRKFWCTKNRETGQVVHYSSEAKRDKGIMMREAFSHGFVPKHIRSSKKGKNHIVTAYRRI